MDGISVVRAAALPAFALVISVGLTVGSIGSASIFQTDRTKVETSRKQFSLIEPIHRVRVAGFEASAQYWKRELNQRADISGSTASLRKALENPVLNNQPAIVEAREKLAAIKSAPSTKQEMGFLGAIGDGVEAASTAVLKTMSSQNNDLGSATTAMWNLHGMAHMVTHYRVVRNVDPRPTSKEVMTYIAGGVAGAEVNPSRTFKSELVADVKGFELRNDLTAVAKLSTAKIFIDETNWSLEGGTALVPHASFAEFDHSRQAVLAATNRAYSNEIKRINQRLASEIRSLDAAYSRNRNITWGAIAGVIGSLLWLFGRIGSKLRAMRSLAETDLLTKSLNRTGIRRVVDPWFVDRGTKPLALAVIDLDQFKSLNDTYGHQGGDRILSGVSGSLHGTTIPDQTSIGRWGGDEFVAVFRLPQNSTVSSFDRLFERVHSSVATPIAVGDDLVTATATMGVVVCSCGSCDFDDLFRTADHALYVGKFEGRNRWTSVSCDFDLSQRMTDRTLITQTP
jgi:diguanylate cyclase (GGDEF)-like protein